MTCPLMPPEPLPACEPWEEVAAFLCYLAQSLVSDWPHAPCAIAIPYPVEVRDE